MKITSFRNFVYEEAYACPEEFFPETNWLLDYDGDKISKDIIFERIFVVYLEIIHAIMNSIMYPSDN